MENDTETTSAHTTQNTQTAAEARLSVTEGAAMLARFENPKPEARNPSEETANAAPEEVTTNPPETVAKAEPTPATDPDERAAPEAEDQPVSIRLGDDDESDDANGEDPLADNGDSNGWPESATKRVGELTAKRKAAEERAQALETRAKELEEQLANHSAPRLQPTAEQPLADVSWDELPQIQSEAQSVLQWAIQNPDGAEVPGKDGDSTWKSAEEVSRIRANAEKALRIDIPQREAFLREQAANAERVQTLYPDLFKPGPASDAGFQLLHRYPDLQKFPNWLELVGHILLGQEVAAGRKAVIAKGAPKPAAQQPKPSQPASDKRPVAQDPQERQLNQVRKAIADGGSLSVRDGAKLLAAMESAA